jgi:hypothetical protein
MAWGNAEKRRWVIIGETGMPARVKFAALVASAFIVAPGPAAALGPLPWCFSTLPFDDVLVVWPIRTGGGQRDGSGLDLAGNRTMSVNTFTKGGTLTIGYTIYPQPGFDPVFAGGTINLATRSGPGECFAPGFFDCGEFTFQQITCPKASSSARVPPSSAKVMGKR